MKTFTLQACFRLVLVGTLAFLLGLLCTVGGSFAKKLVLAQNNAMHGGYDNPWAEMCDQKTPLSTFDTTACLFSVRGKCDGFPNLGFDTTFFNDEFRGGPIASTEVACRSRLKEWQGACKTDDILMKFMPGSPGPTIVKTPRLEDAYVVPWGRCRSWPVMQPKLGINGADLYIDQLKRIVLNFQYGCRPPNQNCVTTLQESLPGPNPGAMSMIGWNGITMVELAIRDILNNGIAGDLIETGVYRGGTCVFMRGVIAALAEHENRVVWVADSFRGIPPVQSNKYSVDKVHVGAEKLLSAEVVNSLEGVKENFFQAGLLEYSRVQFLKGWFNESLPDAPIKQLALIRLDGDLFESTWDAIIHLYPKLSMNGYVIVDDYGDWVGCRRAINLYRDLCGEVASVTRFDGVPQPNGGDKQIGKFATWRKSVECRLSHAELYKMMQKSLG